MDIISLPIELDENKIDGRFRLVNIITQRSKELAHRGSPKVVTKAKKVTTIALEEAVEYKLDFITGEEAKQANEEAKKLDYKRFLEEKRRESEQEDLSELEKDLKFYLDEKEEISSKRSTLETLFMEPGTESSSASEPETDIDEDIDKDIDTEDKDENKDEDKDEDVDEGLDEDKDTEDADEELDEDEDEDEDTEDVDEEMDDE
ncbi:MAG: DNA-directed RNA polymerase subunit omega [Nitrospirae bacterium]|nr:DNA-directed RNA polymerase subunit omega [Nitrospirota bacterium]